MVSLPSLLDRTEIVHLADGRREYLVPGAAEEAAEWASWQSAYAAQTAEKEHAEAVAARVRSVIVEGPPARDDALAAHVTWLELARQREAGAIRRQRESQAAAERHVAAIAARDRITEEVRSAVERWASYAVSTDDDAADMRPVPATRSDELAALANEIEATRPLFDVAPRCAEEAEVAVAVTSALELMLPFRRAEALIAAETPRLEQLLDNAVRDLERIYGHLSALDAAAAPTWEQSMELRDIGALLPRRLVTGSVTLPSIRGRRIEFEVRPDQAALATYRSSLNAEPSPTPPNNGNSLQLALSAPVVTTLTDRVAKAIQSWRGD
jgi:hypothetical protein